MKGRHEWFIRVPWGKLALVGHGHPDGDPVFMVHGRQDSSSVFEPLIEQMSEQYYYVALDMPGNGLSDAFPPGPKLMRFHFLAAMDLAVKHLGWDKFIFVGHSMGCEQGLFYSVINPGQITKMILLDAGPTLMRMQVQDHLEYQRYYDTYYRDYEWENFERKPYLREMALQALQRHRELTGDQCELILSRNFHGFPFYHKNNSNEKRNEDEGQNADATGTKNTNEQNTEKAPNTNTNEDTNETHNTNERNTEEAPFGASSVWYCINGYGNTNETQNTNEQNTEEALKIIGSGNTNGTHNTNEQNTEGTPTTNANENKHETQNATDARSAVALNVDSDASDYSSEFSPCIRDRREVGYLSWDNRLKNLAPQNYGNDYYFALFKKIPPTLLVAASDGAKNVPPNPKWRQGAKELLDRMATLDNFHRVDVEGSHDVHFTHPERVLPYVNAFLQGNRVSSKL